MLSLDISQLLAQRVPHPRALRAVNHSEETDSVTFQRGWQGQHSRSGASPGAGTHLHPSASDQGSAERDRGHGGGDMGTPWGWAGWS